MSNDTPETTGLPVGVAKTRSQRCCGGPRDLLKHAVEAELQAFLDAHRHLELANVRQGAVRNDHLPARTSQANMGPEQTSSLSISLALLRRPSLKSVLTPHIDPPLPSIAPVAAPYRPV